MLQQKWLIPKFDALHLNIDNFIQLSMRFSDRAQTEKVVNKLVKECIGLHLKAENGYLYHIDKPVDVGMLPNFKTLEEVNHYAREKMHPDINQSLGLISSNEDTICIVLNHLCGDGGYFKRIVNNINSDIKEVKYPFPISSYTSFLDQINSLSKNKSFSREPKITSITKETNTDHLKPEVSLLKYPIPSLTCYNKDKQKCDYLTEALSTSLIISASLLNKKTSQNLNNIVNSPFGIEIATDIRKFSQKYYSLNMCNWYSLINVNTSPTLNMKIGEIYQQLKKDMNDKLILTELLKTQNSIQYKNDNHKQDSNEDLIISLSNVGRLNLKGPLKDALITNLNYKKSLRGMFSLITYTITDENGRNDLVTHIRYNSSGLDEKMSKLVNNSIKYLLQNISPNCTLLDALKQVQKYQQNYLSLL